MDEFVVLQITQELKLSFHSLLKASKRINKTQFKFKHWHKPFSPQSEGVVLNRAEYSSGCRLYSFVFALVLCACVGELEYMGSTLKNNSVTVFPACLSWCLPFLSMPDPHSFSQIVSNQLPFKIPFSLGFLKFYFVYLCILCVCVCGMCIWGHLYATAYIYYVWAEDNFVSGLLLTFLFSLELNSGLQACAVNLLTHRTTHYLTSRVFQSVSHHVALLLLNSRCSPGCMEVFCPHLPACWDYMCATLCLAFPSFLKFN